MWRASLSYVCHGLLPLYARVSCAVGLPGTKDPCKNVLGLHTLTSAMDFFPFMQGLPYTFLLQWLPKEGKYRPNGVKDAP